jgi:hypothetical protein
VGNYSPDDLPAFEVWDELGAANPGSVGGRLCVVRAQIEAEDFAKVDKFAVIDVEGRDPVVVLGSCNWTDGGVYGNDENTLIVHDPELALAYYGEWKRLWGRWGARGCAGGSWCLCRWS